MVFPLPASLLLSRQTMVYSILYIPIIMSWILNRVSAPVAPPSRTIPSSASSSPPISPDHGRQLLLQPRSIIASKCISKLPQWRPTSSHHHGVPSDSPIPLGHGLIVHLQTRLIMASQFTPLRPSNCLYKLARSWPRSASPNTLNHSLQVYIQARSITASKFARSWPSKCISQFALSQPPSVSPNSLSYGLQVWTIISSKCMSKLAQPRPRTASLWTLDYGVVKRWRLKAGSPSSTLRRTSHGIPREFVKKTSSGSRSVARGLDDVKGFPAIMNHTNCVDQWKLAKSVWDQKLGKIACVFRIMRCLSALGSSKYTLPVAESITVISVSPYVYI